MALVVLVRHGLSQANMDGIIAGRLDSPLTEIGRQQARITGKLLSDLTFHHAIGSRLSRAKETLEIVLDELNQELIPSYHDALLERDWGELEGTPHNNQGVGQYTEEQWRLYHSWTGKAVGGESYEDLFNRIVPFFSVQLLPKLKTNKNILVVAHNGVLKPLQGHLERLPREKTGNLNLKNCQAKLYHFSKAGRLIRVENRFPDPE